MYEIYNLTSSENVKVTDKRGPFTVIAHLQQISRPSADPIRQYYSALLKNRQRQLICSLSQGDVLIGEGMIQWTVGQVAMTTNVTSPISYLDKIIRSRLIRQSAIVLQCSGSGEVILEPVDCDVLLVDLQDWMEGIVLEPGMFLACERSVSLAMSGRTNFSSFAFGQEGLFNLTLKGKGAAALKIPCPKESLVEVVLKDDVIRLDGSFAIAWSSTLSFQVEKAGETIPASVLSSEGFVNTYRGTGKILLAPMLQAIRSMPDSQGGKV